MWRRLVPAIGSSRTTHSLSHDERDGRGRHALIRQKWYDDGASSVADDDEHLLPSPLNMVLRCLTSCCAPQAVESAEDGGPSAQVETELAELKRVPEPNGYYSNGHSKAPYSNSDAKRQKTPETLETIFVPCEDGRPNKFQKVRSDGPWWVSRSANGGKLFWMHEQTHEMTWRQPVPRIANLPPSVQVGEGMRAWTQVGRARSRTRNATPPSRQRRAPPDPIRSLAPPPLLTLPLLAVARSSLTRASTARRPTRTTPAPGQGSAGGRPTRRRSR